ncbi:hypothetical protein CGLO_17811 [Colletotrichum gloeosporioides Cg-14]|uniref:Uncharacterized protein n=1 Tax=Colletotrichum gloeosporioides (strain Cg-14) TaxID=1237896 RepID=T0JK25_COLGC|nr:hypothetical protein CGLO_17811 [Colletotrichum gloeosporioides Cg-14]
MSRKYAGQVLPTDVSEMRGFAAGNRPVVITISKAAELEQLYSIQAEIEKLEKQQFDVHMPINEQAQKARDNENEDTVLHVGSVYDERNGELWV